MDEDSDMISILDVWYGGAPDECNFHWPVKFVEGYCPVDGCPESKNSEPPWNRMVR